MTTANIASETIRTDLVGRVRTAIDALNRRAKRLRAAPYDLHVSAPYVRRRYIDVGKSVVEEVVDVVLEGTPVKLQGWTFAAKLDFLSDSAEGVVISKAPGFETLEIERPDGKRCDHCRTSRRRAVCYVVQNDAGARKVIGSSCLTDFTGMGRNVESLVALAFAAAQVFGGLDDEGRDGYSNADDLDSYLAVVAGMIRTYGWMSRKQARETGAAATADEARGWLRSKQEERRKHWPELGAALSRADRATALRSIHWCEEIDAGNDYEQNIVAIAHAGYVTDKHCGLAASIVSAWLRHRESLVQRASRPKCNPDATSGQVGKRSDFQVFVAGVRAFSNDFGLTHRVALVDVATGAEMIWWASGEVPETIVEIATTPRRADEPVPTVMVTATVKKHDVYQGKRQTVLSRLRICVPKAPKAPRKRKAKASSDDVAETCHA